MEFVWLVKQDSACAVYPLCKLCKKNCKMQSSYYIAMMRWTTKEMKMQL